MAAVATLISRVRRRARVGWPLPPVRAIGSERAVNEVLDHPDPGNADRRASAPPPDQAADASRAHQPLHALAADTLAIAKHELSVTRDDPQTPRKRSWISAIRTLKRSSSIARAEGLRACQA